ncbi:hypothetical protein AAFN86_21750 [Roseomonas sp. CAU 1739]|uniref:hypothetical protein n=1 Tax=Roseomonas sp. CAU 1739 TaxID=3140364 RepID=UPI00325ACAA4
MRLPALILLALVALVPAARGQDVPRVALRVGTHPDLGRLVFDWPSRIGYGVEEQDGRVVIRFAAPGQLDLAAARRPPRNVLAVERDGDAVAIRIAPGARPRHFRLGNRIVLDIRDPAAAAEPAPPARPAAAARSPTQPAPPPAVPVASPAPDPLPASPAPPPATAPTALAPAAAAQPAARTQPAAALRDAATGASALRLLPGGTGLVLDAGPEAGLAMFRRGEWVHIVVDRVLVADPTLVRGHAVFAGLESQPAGEGTVFRLPLPAPSHLIARRDGEAWVLEARRDAPPIDATVLRAVPEAGPPARLLLLGGSPGGTVAMADPATGETLLVGTLRRPGPGIATVRRLPDFDLLPSMLGAVLLARSDRLGLRVVTEDRFAVQAGAGESLMLGALPGQEPPPAALAMSRLLDLPTSATPVLLERLRNVLTTLNAAAPLARGPSRRDAAETLLALGMPQEAQAMAAIAFQEDPQAREDARLLLAHGVAALLSGRPGDARAIMDARLPPRDEVALWRALLALSRGEDAAAALRVSAPLVLIYPEALRARALPLVAEALAQGGEATAAAALLAQAGDVAGLDLARAMVMEAAGRDAAATEAYAALVAGRDRRRRAIAQRRLAELRLAAGSIDQAGAAEALEQSLFAWRGGPEELALRRRIAALRLEALQGQQAHALLEETARLFPDAAAALRPALQNAFAVALETAPPLVAATMFDAQPDMLPGGARGEAAVLMLAERLAGLDLPDRAAALLRRAVDASEDAPARAAIGARLAVMRLAERDAAGTIAALDASESTSLDAPIVTQRALLRARALARRGARTEAEDMLATLGPAGSAARAELRAEAQDWRGAAAAMADHLDAILPQAPAPLGQDHRVALARHAAYLALAGDDAGLAALRAAQGPRMEGGALAEAFGVLTANPVRAIADLPRLQRELGLMRVMPARLEALRAGVQVAR